MYNLSLDHSENFPETRSESPSPYFFWPHKRSTLSCWANHQLLGRMIVDAADDGRNWVRWDFAAGAADPELRSQLIYLGLDYIFAETKATKVSTCLSIDSTHEIGLLRRFGFEWEGTHRYEIKVEETLTDGVWLGLLSKDWLEYLQARTLEMIRGDVTRSSEYWVGKAFQHDFSISRDELEGFATISGDRNTIHLDDKAAQRRGFPSRIVHGMLTSSVFSRIFGMQFPVPCCVYLNQKLSFRRFVLPDEPLQARVQVVSQVRRKVTVETQIINRETGQLKIEGEALLLLPV